jgi:hypothetical protein
MSSVNCPRCHYSNPADHLYCQNCGTRLPRENDAPVPSAVAPPDQPHTTDGSLEAPPSAPPNAPKSRRTLWIVLLASGAVLFCGLCVVVGLVLVWAGGNSSDDSTDGTPVVTGAELESFRPDPAGGEPSTTGESISSDSGTVTVLLPPDDEWDVVSTDDDFISLEHLYGYLDIGVYRSDIPTSPDDLMREEVESVQNEFPGTEVVVGPDYFEFENGEGVIFALGYELDLVIIDLSDLDVYALGVDTSETVVIWVNIYGLEEDWDELAAAVEPVVQSIRSPLFE